MTGRIIIYTFVLYTAFRNCIAMQKFSLGCIVIIIIIIILFNHNIKGAKINVVAEA
jgi:hypothetical protein